MLRLRLAILALACGLFVTLSGCRTYCEDDRLFPRLFRSNYAGGGLFSGNRMAAPGPECECNQGQFPGIFEPTSNHGPIMMSPASSQPTMQMPMPAPIPITNVPTNQAPQVFKIPQAAPTPYVPAH
jgi:hypothetical protein